MKPTVKYFEEVIENVYSRTTFSQFTKEAANACHALAEKMAEEFGKGFAGWIRNEPIIKAIWRDEKIWFHEGLNKSFTTDELLQLYQDYLTSQTPE